MEHYEYIRSLNKKEYPKELEVGDTVLIRTQNYFKTAIDVNSPFSNRPRVDVGWVDDFWEMAGKVFKIAEIVPFRMGDNTYYYYTLDDHKIHPRKRGDYYYAGELVYSADMFDPHYPAMIERGNYFSEGPLPRFEDMDTEHLRTYVRNLKDSIL